MSRIIRHAKIKVRRFINRFNKAQDKIDELRWELTSAQTTERRLEIKEEIRKLEK